MFRNKLFKGFVLIIVIYGVLSALLGISTIKRHVMNEAQNRVRLDLSSAWAVYNNHMSQIQTILQLASRKQIVKDCFKAGNYESRDLNNRLIRIRKEFDLDFLGLVTADGVVVLRTTAPFHKGDYRNSDQIISRALRGEAVKGVELWSQPEMTAEADGLAERAFFELDDTPLARKKPNITETRGMMMMGAVPVSEGGSVLGVVYGGVLVNRNYNLIDRIQDVVYKHEKYQGRPLGTATIFLHDSRVTTTVLRKNDNRALGTRVSKEVADRVLDNGISWVGEAFVVKDWYLTAYDPIRDVEGSIIGMLYVGILRQPFLDYSYSITLKFIALSCFVLILGLIIAFILADRFCRPIGRLVSASKAMSNGHVPGHVSSESACQEMHTLIHAFNEMKERLVEREESLKATNRSYMETLGFVSHELKSPVASILNYLYLMRQNKLGPLTEKQKKAVGVCERNTNRVIEMIRHYLNLSRIENKELDPNTTCVRIRDEIIVPLIESQEIEISRRGISVHNNISADICLEADVNMVREVFENLLSNALKYGCEGGSVMLEAAPAGDMCEFTVTNEGKGVPPERMDELFKKFSRLETGSEHIRRGTGLGLFITKNIVEVHGGSIRVESVPGETTSFVFTLPLYKNRDERDDDE